MELSPRQVHLDFHTSEFIPAIASEFNSQEFARTLKDASVSSVTVFARCHHGWMYYPSKQFPQLIHPNLRNRNLLLDQVKALHKEGIKAPVYITVQWDYQSANAHPEWLIRKKDGAHEGGSFCEPGFYQSLCVNTGYYAFLAQHTKEVCEMLGDELDGIFFDIVGIRPCLCSTCRAEMKQLGVDMLDVEAVQDFAKKVIDRFKNRMTELIRSYNNTCSVFYNAGHIGPCTLESKDAYSHFELESLPSGSWGYLHFPVSARYARTLGKDCLGMTGKFHTSWGDFHSLKNQAALEFECFRMLSYGFACSIGDQLEPNGALNTSTYKLIGKVYGQFKKFEAWARPSKAVVEAALVTPEGSFHEFAIPDSVMGAAQLLEELAVQFDIIDQAAVLEDYKLIILPDDLHVTENFHERLEQYVEKGGKVIACAKGGLLENGKYPDCFGVEHFGQADKYPDFIVPAGELAHGLEEGNEYVIYERGEKISPVSAEKLLEARAPYFNREKDQFCSHFYTSSAKGENYVVGTKNGSVILFSHPIFTQYRKNAPYWCKKLIDNAIRLLYPERLVEHNGPSTMTVSLLRQPDKNRICAHILTYIPVRKSQTIDIIEERTKLYNTEIRFNIPEKIITARQVPEGTELLLQDGKLIVPEIDGYAIIELSY